MKVIVTRKNFIPITLKIAKEAFIEYCSPLVKIYKWIRKCLK